MAFTQDERFEWPDGPEGYDDDERVVLANDAFVALQF